jgi:large subunit ribosomal protein L2
MGLKLYNPTSAGRRFASTVDRSEVSPGGEVRSLIRKLKKKGGRNARGVITSRHRGGGSRRKFRVIDLKRDKDNIPAKVAAIEYDPNRSAHIALLDYADGEKRYILAPDGLKVGDTIVSGEKAEPKVGHCLALKSIPLGLSVHNIELTPGRGGQLVRGAGGVAQLSAREGDYAVIVMPSGEIRKIHVNCRATIGQVGNLDHINIWIGKAGRNRWKGWRPYVRGVAQNPVSHPMGGGEGRSSGGRHSCSPTGVLSKGGRTRSKRALSNRFIVRRRPSGPHVGTP